MQRPANSTGGSELRQRILSSFWSDHIEPEPVPVHYRLGLLVVAVAMVMLPLAYAAMIVAVLYGLYAYVAHSLDSGSFGELAAWPLHVAVGFVGPVLIAFMIKPFFSGRYQQFKPRPLRKDQEPLLFAFIERLCAILGAPFPKRIYVTCKVNASAGFRRGMSSFFSHDLELTLGLPLVAGLDLRQLAGVLAHELGHFTQGTGMRFAYIIRSVSLWFARVVYERDAWDLWLYRQTADPDTPFWVAALIKLCKMMIALARGILWLFMWIGYVLSSYLIRQMEYGADRRQVRLVGTEAFETCMWELFALNVAHQKSLADLEESLREHRLADDLPGLVVVNRRELPVRVIDSLRSQLASEKTSLFATHPAARDRVANARNEQARPAFSSDLPASVLFRDFARLSKTVSLDFYRAALGLTELHGIQAEVGALGSQLQQAEQPDGLQWTLEGALDRLCSQLAEIRRKLEGAPYPFDHADAETTLQSYIVPQMPDLGLGFDLYELGGYAIEHAYEVYFRLVGRLAFIAEQLERAAGLEPLPRVRAAAPAP